MKAALLGLLQHLPRLLLLAAIALAAHQLHSMGERAGRAHVQALWDQQTIDELAAGVDQLAQAIQRTEALGGQLATIQTENQKGHADAKRASQHLLDGLRDGTIRLSVPASPAGAHVPSTGADSAAAWPGQARTELDPSTGANLVAITDEGDAGIRDLNACIEAYNAVREQVNTGTAKP